MTYLDSSLQSLAPIMAIIAVMLTGMIILIGDAFSSAWKQNKAMSAIMAFIGLGLAGLLTCLQFNSPGNENPLFAGAVVADNFSQVTNLILIITAALAILLALTYLKNRDLQLGEYYALIMFSTSGAMLMGAATDLIVLFIAIEILSVALYVLAGFARTEARSEEAALKYFLLGAFAAGFLLYGIALIYGGSAVPGTINGGTTNLSDLAASLKGHKPSAMLMTGVALLLVGLGFKAALVPFHQWTPDVYEGAPTSVTAYMAAVAKIGAFAAIMRIFNALIPVNQYWLIAVQVLAVLTMFGGNILAVTQENVKRMLAYSSIAHAGYLMVAVSAMGSGDKTAHPQAFGAVTFYLFGYALATIGAFGVLIWLSRRGKDCQTLADLKGLARTDPAPAYILLVFMLSMGGIPPTMGFMGKWFIFNAVVAAHQYGMAIALGLASAISVYYYLKVVWMMCFQEPEAGTLRTRAEAAGPVQFSVYVTLLGSLLLGIAPGLIQGLVAAASTLAKP